MTILEWFLKDNVMPKTAVMTAENWASEINSILKYIKIENLWKVVNIEESF